MHRQKWVDFPKNPVSGIYQRYKGDLYYVEKVTVDSGTESESPSSFHVDYRPLYGWFHPTNKPHEEFVGWAFPKGKRHCRRFKLVCPAGQVIPHTIKPRIVRSLVRLRKKWNLGTTNFAKALTLDTKMTAAAIIVAIRQTENEVPF